MSERAQMMKQMHVLADFGDFELRFKNLDEMLTEACRLVTEALSREAMTVIQTRFWRHPVSFPCPSSSQQTRLTWQCRQWQYVDIETSAQLYVSVRNTIARHFS